MKRVLLVGVFSVEEYARVAAVVPDGATVAERFVDDALLLNRASLGSAASGLGKKVADQYSPGEDDAAEAA
jgi:hypothetical protein